jgi:hypothetical protein
MVDAFRVFRRGRPRCAYRPGMERRTSLPRSLTNRSMLAVGLFAASVVPGWTLGDLAERWTGSVVLDWLVMLGWSAAAIRVLAPYASYRRRDALFGLVPLLGWYLLCVLAWRVALLPYRDWEPRGDELWRARWLTGDLIGYWRASPLGSPRRPMVQAPEDSTAADPRPASTLRAGRAQPAARRPS